MRGEKSALDAYGRNLGIAFQLVDDAIDYVSDGATMGKDAGDDFRDGKVTLPVILAYARGSESRPRLLADAIEGRRSSDEDLAAPSACSAHRRDRRHARPRPPLRPARDRRARLASRAAAKAPGRSGRVRGRAGLLTVLGLSPGL
jgi:hypothetical protein